MRMKERRGTGPLETRWCVMRVLIQLRPSPDVVAAVADPAVSMTAADVADAPSRGRPGPLLHPGRRAPARARRPGGDPLSLAPAADVLLRRRRGHGPGPRGDLRRRAVHPAHPASRPPSRRGGGVRRPGDRAGPHLRRQRPGRRLAGRGAAAARRRARRARARRRGRGARGAGHRHQCRARAAPRRCTSTLDAGRSWSPAGVRGRRANSRSTTARCAPSTRSSPHRGPLCSTYPLLLLPAPRREPRWTACSPTRWRHSPTCAPCSTAQPAGPALPGDQQQLGLLLPAAGTSPSATRATTPTTRPTRSTSSSSSLDAGGRRRAVRRRKLRSRLPRRPVRLPRAPDHGRQLPPGRPVGRRRRRRAGSGSATPRRAPAGSPPASPTSARTPISPARRPSATASPTRAPRPPAPSPPGWSRPSAPCGPPPAVRPPSCRTCSAAPPTTAATSGSTTTTATAIADTAGNDRLVAPPRRTRSVKSCFLSP